MSDPDEFHLMPEAPDPLTTPEAVILAWANSGGFAATHDQGATPEAIADDMLRFLQAVGWKLVRA